MITVSPNKPGSTSLLSENLVQDAFHSYLRSSLTQAKAENLLDDEMLSSAESYLMVAGPALCLFFAALRCITNPPSVLLPRSIQLILSSSESVSLSYKNCPLVFKSLFRDWVHLVPRIQSLPPEQQRNLARIICNLPPLSVPQNLDLGGIAIEMRAIALKISQRRSFQDRYVNVLQAALDFDTRVGRGAGAGDWAWARTKKIASFIPPPVYEHTNPLVSRTHVGSHRVAVSLSPSYIAHSASLPASLRSSHSPPSSETSSLRDPSPTTLAPGISSGIEIILEMLYAALGRTLEQHPFLRYLLKFDPPRAYFVSVSLAILFVSTNAVDLKRRAVIGVTGIPLTLADCPQDLKPLMVELIAFGEAANDLVAEDDKSAIRAILDGNDVPEQTRMERVKKILLNGQNRVALNGEWRSAEGRVVSFANRIWELAVKITRFSGFRERHSAAFRVLAGAETYVWTI